MTTEPRVAAVVLNWRRPDETIACVCSVAALDYDNLDIIVCDNASGDGSMTRIVAELTAAIPTINAGRRAKGWHPFRIEAPGVDSQSANVERDAGERRLRLIDTGRNGGYAFGNNIGIAAAFDCADVAYAWVLNNDTVVDARALSALTRTMEADCTIGMCGALVLYLETPDVVQTLGGGYFRAERARCEQLGAGLPCARIPDGDAIAGRLDYINGAASLVSRRLFETVGPMEESYFLFFEEIDWATRARAAGFRLGYCPEAIVYHTVGAATGSNDEGAPSPLSTYYMERSRFRFLRKYHPGLLPLACALILKQAATLWVRGETARAKAMLRGAMHMRRSAEGGHDDA